MALQQDVQTRHHNQHAKARKFEVGDQVMAQNLVQAVNGCQESLFRRRDLCPMSYR